MNQRLLKLALFSVALLLCLAGCGADTPASDTTQPNLILTVKQSGGCVRMGPNCAVHTLFSNGEVQLARNLGEQTSEVEVTASIDTGLVESWLMAIEDENFNALRQNLPAGQCAGCVDGVDLEYIVHKGSDSESFSSIEYAFDTSFTFFAITEDIYTAMQAAAPLVLQQR